MNVRRFQESITRELNITKNRVRDLIGDAHWGEEGRFKEAILRKCIRQFLPSNLKIGTGFIVKNDDYRHGHAGEISHQLDIIIYDDCIPVIFKEGDFVILTETAVRGIIEVKTSILNYAADDQNALNNIVEKINIFNNFKTFAPNEYRKKFIGIFSFEYNQNFLHQRIDDALQTSNGLVNHISLGPNLFIRFWENTRNLEPPIENYEGRCYLRYNLPSLSFSYFISNLLHIVSNEDPIERYWYSFPIEGTKEIYREDQVIELDN